MFHLFAGLCMRTGRQGGRQGSHRNRPVADHVLAHHRATAQHAPLATDNAGLHNVELQRNLAMPEDALGTREALAGKYHCERLGKKTSISSKHNTL